MNRSICILALSILLPACERGVKPAAKASAPSTTTPATDSTIDQTPELETHPLALYEGPRPPSAADLQAMDKMMAKARKETERLNELVAKEAEQLRGLTKREDGFTSTANQFCPIMQKMKLNATTAVEHTVQFEGKTIGFCCNDCREAWDSMSNDERRAVLTTVLNNK